MRIGGVELLLSGQLGVSHEVHPVCSEGHTTPTNMWPAPRAIQWPGWVPTGLSVFVPNSGSDQP